MKRVISLAIFGAVNGYGIATSFYRRHLGAVIRGYRALFPGWEIWIHHDDSLYDASYGAALFALSRRGVIRLVRVAATVPRCLGMFWRLRPIWDADVEYVLARDADAVPMYTERQAVDEFISSGAAAHALSAIPSHDTELPGGLCGFHAPEFRTLIGVESWDALAARTPCENWDHYGQDEVILRTVVWPLVRSRVCEHRLGGAHPWGGVHASYSVASGAPAGIPAALAGSRALGPYMGCAGFDADRACQFFDSIVPSPRIAAAEEFAGESRTGVADPMPWAVIASDRNDFYSFFAPLTTRLWRRLGVRVRLYLVGTAEEWSERPRDRLVVAASREAGAAIRFVPRLEQFANGTVAQVVRLFASGFDFDDGEVVYQSDIDLWPLSKSFFCERDFDRLHLLAAQGDGKHFSMTVAARAKDWRALMGLSRGGGMEALGEALGVVAGFGASLSDAWNVDERILTQRVLASPLLASAIQVPRGGDIVPHDRIDRSRWVVPESLDGLVDAHLLRPGPDHWHELRRLFALALPTEAGWADRYVTEWRSCAS